MESEGDATAIPEEEVTNVNAEVEQEEPQEPEQPTEDPELTALKEEIANLESDLKAKRVEANRNLNLADDYSEGGYQRKCAEMDNYRRSVAATSNNNQLAAKANILQSLLPNLDELNYISQTANESEFAQSYIALRNDFANSLSSMGVTSFTVEVGTQMDTRRCHVLSEQVCEDVEEAGIILGVEFEGYEVDGNVIRLAEVVVSKGKEEVVEEEQQEAVEGENVGSEGYSEEGIAYEE